MRTIVALTSVLFVAGCTLDDGAAPALTGPSEFSLSVTLSASPDQLPRDGSSQAVVSVAVRDASARPVSGQRLSVASSAGTLSAADLVTNSSGQASVTLTAPPPGTVGNFAAIQVVPVGTDARNDAPRTLVIALIGTSNSTAPTPNFVVNPASPEIQQATVFDASTTTDEGGFCLNACLYEWDFGDGSTDTGLTVTHRYTSPGSYSVVLTVTDAAGTTASKTSALTVKAVTAPSVTLTVAPNPPVAGRAATLIATTTTAAGHGIVKYEWNFGDGVSATTTSPTVSHTYSSTGLYVASVTVTDDTGQQGSNSLSITVGSGITFPQPPFTVSPSAPITNQAVSFNASGVTTIAGATITQYDWDFGDGTTATGTAATVTKPNNGYGTAGSYTVRLTVTDSAGRTGTATVAVSVSDP
jgi:PKD repeat protein